MMKFSQRSTPFNVVVGVAFTIVCTAAGSISKYINHIPYYSLPNDKSILGRILERRL